MEEVKERPVEERPEGELLNYYCSFEIYGSNSKELTADKIIIKELDEFGHYTQVKDVKKFNVLA